MPGGDRSGPSGMGPGTGRAAGLCYGSDTPGFTTGGAGRGFGRRMGRGSAGFGGFRGRGGYGRAGYGIPFHHGWRWNAFSSKEEELRYLKDEAELLKKTTGELEKRIENLSKEK